MFVFCEFTLASLLLFVGCLGTEERITAKGCSGPEALNKTETLAAGAGGHQHAAQKASRHPSGFPGLP